jgi:glycerol-3-phosphate dehydrogenase
MTVSDTEVLIIGAGALGAATARELSQYKVDVTLVEKNVDAGWGITKANVGVVCQGKDTLEFRPEYFRSKLLWRSMSMMEPLAKELDIPFMRVGGFELARTMQQKEKLDKLINRTKSLGLGEDKFMWHDELLKCEPNIAEDIIGGVHDPDIAIIEPVSYTMALVENAKQNGVKVLFDTNVEDIEYGHNDFIVRTSSGDIRTRFVVNAAGEKVDKVAAMVNADDFVLFPVKGYVGVLDKKARGLVNSLVSALPSEPGELNIVVPTTEDNLLFGIQLQINRRGDYSTTTQMREKAIENARKLIDGIDEKDIINEFSGFLMMRNFELGWHECVVGPSKLVPRFINMTIGYPGISASPGAAEEAVNALKEMGLSMDEDPEFNPNRECISDFSRMGEKDRDELIRKDPSYGHVVCRCETVTEGEIVEAIRRGATTLDGVKYRVRAGMGRCQGGFCGPRITKILARELGIPEEEVTKKGEESRHLLYRAKQLL